MKTKQLVASIATVAAGVLSAGSAQALPVASAQSVVAFENFQIFRGGTNTQIAASDFSTLSVTSSQLTAANVTGFPGATQNPASSDGSPLVASSQVGAVDPNIAAQLPATATTDFKVFTLPFAGNFSISASNDYGSPITGFGVSPQDNADLHNASYASLDTLNGTAGTNSSSQLATTFVFSGYSGVLDFKFDIGAHIAAFLSAGAAQSASASWSVSFDIVDQATNLSVGSFTRGNNVSNNAPGNGLTNLGTLNSVLNPDQTVSTTSFGFSTAALDALKTYELTATISTRAQVIRNAVPEPEVLSLLGIGLLGMGFSSRKSQKVSSVAYA